MTDHSIKGKTVLIAGGAKNLGGLISRDLAAQGSKATAGHYNTGASKPAADKTVAGIKAAGEGTFAFHAHLTMAGAVEKLFGEAKAAMCSIDIAINTVGNVVTSLLGAYTPFYAAHADTKAPVEHFTRSASKEFGERGISVTAIGPGPMNTPFFYLVEGAGVVAYHKTATALSGFSKTGLPGIEDIVLLIRCLVSDGWWMTGQTILVNGGHATK